MANGFPMFYHTGFLSGWYQIGKGEILNNEEDTNSFPKVFVMVQSAAYTKLA
jgi:hypothetical protein